MNRRRSLVGEDSCADCKDTCYSSKCVAEASPPSGVDVVGGVVGGVGVAVAVGGVGEVGAGVLGGEGAGGGVIPAVAVVGVAGGVAAADVGGGAGVAEQVGDGQAGVVGRDGAVGVRARESWKAHASTRAHTARQLRRPDFRALTVYSSGR